MIPRVNLIEAKTILTKSGLPGSDWVINPYNGCLFGCMYCYAAQIAKWKHPDEEWGTYLDVKINAPELLKIELEKISKKMDKFFKLSFDEFVKELLKQKINLNLKQKDEWEDYFENYKKELSDLKEKIDKTDSEIDKMVYTLYGLNEKEIKIVEESLK